MRKYTLLLLLVAGMTSVFAQGRVFESKLNYYVDTAAKEFSLTAEKIAELHADRLEYMNGMLEVRNNIKAGKLSKEDSKLKFRELNKDFTNDVIAITGKTKKELLPFSKRMQEELKKIK